MAKRLTQTEIKGWLAYWQQTRCVAVENILSFEQVYQARKFCRVMREGVFADVSDLEIWRALTTMRAAPAA